MFQDLFAPNCFLPARSRARSAACVLALLLTPSSPFTIIPSLVCVLTNPVRAALTSLQLLLLDPGINPGLASRQGPQGQAHRHLQRQGQPQPRCRGRAGKPRLFAQCADRLF